MLGRTLAEEGKWEEARALLSPALGNESTRPDGMRVLGDIELRQGNMAAAAEAYIEYLRAYPSAPHAAELRAFILVHKDRAKKKEGGDR